MPSFSVIDLAEIRWSSKINSWIWSIISWVVTVLSRPGRGASQVEKSPRLTEPPNFGRCHTMVHVSLIFLSELHEFPSVTCLAEKKLMTSRVSMLLKSCASPDMVPFSLCNKKILAIWHMNRPPLSIDTIDSVLRHREIGRTKDSLAPLRKNCICALVVLVLDIVNSLEHSETEIHWKFVIVVFTVMRQYKLSWTTSLRFIGKLTSTSIIFN